MNTAYLSRFLWGLVALCGAAWFGASVSHADIVIDPFTSDQYVEAAGFPVGPMTVSDLLTDTGVLGGERDLTVSRTSANAGSVSVDVNLSFTNGITYSSGPSTAGNALIVYDGVNHAGLGGVDLTEASVNNRFVMGVTSDLGATVVVTVYTDATHFSQASVAVPADPSFNFTTVNVPFASFTAAGSNFTAFPSMYSTIGPSNLINGGRL